MSRRSRVLIVAAVLALAVPAVANAAPRPSDEAFHKAPSSGRISATVKPRVLDGNASVDVMVQLKGDPVAVAEVKADRTFTAGERNRVKRKLRTAQNAIGDDIAAKGGKVLSHLQSAYNGMRVRIAQSKVDALSKLPGVVGVHALTPRTLDNTVSVPFLGVPQVWQDTGYTGKGVKVAIIDTGIDYTHADFGGPGTTAAFKAAAADSTNPADPALFGPSAPRVKGGYDFVGDDYDASAPAGSPAKTPHPDPNPLDCNGHGSHVAGTAGGSGVTADGKTYTGPYDASTPAKKFDVGPGVAPEVDLYALRVFGCEGSTDVVVDAIDWAVDHGMNVINMSLGDDFGRADAPDAVAASNAVAAGVIVVASAGNEGPNPYIVGAPSVGHGVISVAAVDSTASNPGAELSFGGTTMAAINANGADLPSGDFTVVNLTDDPTTPENESLGCSPGAFAKAGISADPGAPKQIAVVIRGTCGRVAKAIYGQQAGADAVVMINNSTEYPPYEGQITSNPDTGAPYTVTIPFLGVRNSDGPALAAASGESLTMTASSLANPAFRHLATFSSGGPVNGTSALSPSIAAPGVSIASAGVGTGTGAVIESGTSMASPHVAGVAALGVQAHPGWRAQDVAAAVVGTGDPEKVDGYSVTVGGAGLVDAAQAVTTRAFATGDVYRTASGRVAQASLSFGFAEPSDTYVGVRTITVHNRGNRPLSYTLSAEPSDQSRPATLGFSTRTVRVRPHSTATVAVKLRVPASTIGSSLGDDQFGFRQVSGSVVLTSGSGVLRVPYLLVPRAQARVDASLTGRHPWSGASTTSTATNGGYPKPIPGPLSVRLTNKGGALDASADFYTWGLADGRDQRTADGGYDLRAAGVQSFDNGADKLVVFAVNNYTRWSTAATQEFDVSVDTNGDGKADYLVFSFDSGYVRTGTFNGLTEVFVQNLATDELDASGYLAQAPTDSSTILLPVDASALGLTASSGAFSYTVASFGLIDGGSDEFAGWAAYNPWAKAISDGDYVTVGRNQVSQVSVPVDAANFAAQRPKGLMVVAFDNRSGGREALLLRAR